jgi:hypothetical protein
LTGVTSLGHARPGGVSVGGLASQGEHVAKRLYICTEPPSGAQLPSHWMLGSALGHQIKVSADEILQSPSFTQVTLSSTLQFNLLCVFK